MLPWSPQQHTKTGLQQKWQLSTLQRHLCPVPPLQPVADEVEEKGFNGRKLPLKPFSPNICPNNSWGYSVSLCLSCYVLSASAASLMLQGFRAGLNHNYALPYSLQLCRERRGLWEAPFKIRWLLKMLCAVIENWIYIKVLFFWHMVRHCPISYLADFHWEKISYLEPVLLLITIKSWQTNE